MADKTGIEWTDATWNPVRGCSRVSEGCRNCYAERVAVRFSAPGQPYAGLVKSTPSGPRWTGRVELQPHHLLDPLKWRTPRRVFVNSMSDLFHEALTDEQIDRVFAVMALAPRHTFQVLTKRPERMREYLSSPWRAGDEVADAIAEINRGRMSPSEHWSEEHSVPAWPLPNVWLGVSVENQATADARIPLLLETPATVRFISAEPLLGPVDLGKYVANITTHHISADVQGMLANRAFDALSDNGRPLTRREAEAQLRYLDAMGVKRIRCSDECVGFSDQTGCPGHPHQRLDWVIVGGESGPGARECQVTWVRSIVRQCKAAGVACFVKQLGADVITRNDDGFMGEFGAHSPREWPEHLSIEDRIEDHPYGYRDDYQGAPVRVHLRNRKGGDASEWPIDLRVREFPRVDAAVGAR